MYRAIDCVECQEGENSIALEQRNSVSQKCLFLNEGYKVAVCLQNNKADWKRRTQ